MQVVLANVINSIILKVYSLSVYFSYIFFSFMQRLWPGVSEQQGSLAALAVRPRQVLLRLRRGLQEVRDADLPPLQGPRHRGQHGGHHLRPLQKDLHLQRPEKVSLQMFSILSVP